ncbi:MAG: mechanosensitive ion channel family protein [Bacteroidia bacterium]
MQSLIDFFPNRWLAYLTMAVVMLLISSGIATILRLVIGKFFRANAQKLNLDPTAFYFIKNAISFVVYLMALIVLFYNIPELKSIGVALFASAGIFAAVAGFAAQAALANMVSGIMIVIFKPYRVNDWLVVGSHSGVVEDITLRHTVIRDFEHRRLMIPNSIISNEVILNSSITDQRVRAHIEIGISYDSPIEKAKEVLQTLALNHELQIDGRSDDDFKNGEPEVPVKVLRYDDSAIIIRAWVWAETPENAFFLKCDVFEQCKAEFDKHKIEIPYPHRTIVYKNKS